MPELDLSILIVSYNVRELVLQCLASIEREEGISLEVILVDNASSDGTLEAVAEGYPEVRLIAPGENLGFARANNLAWKEARGRHILFLNPDTVVHPGTLAGMVRFLDEHPEVGAAGCKLFYGDGTLQYTCNTFPSLLREVYGFYRLERFLPVNALTRRFKLERTRSYEQSREVDWLLGAFLVVPSRVLAEVGAFDERFFLYYEEIDLCRRIRQAGYSIRFLPQFSTIHFTGKSSEQAFLRSFLARQRSRLRYFRKHHPRQFPWLKLFLASGLLLSLIVRLPFLFRPLSRREAVAFGKGLVLTLGEGGPLA